jgi:hypothetical protein
MRDGHAPPDEHGGLWGLRLIQVQVFCIYFWSVVDKLNPVYLAGERMQHVVMWYYTGSGYPEWAGFLWLCRGMAWGSLLAEAALAFGLFVPRLLKSLVPLGVLLHGLFYILFPVSTFSLNMILLYLAFVPVAWVHGAVDDMVGNRQGGEAPDVPTR